jgi:hypothetical protein
VVFVQQSKPEGSFYTVSFPMLEKRIGVPVADHV